MSADLRSPNQKAISQGLKFAWKRKKAAGGWAVKKPKYGNRKVVVDGIKFDSQKEARHWAELQRLEKAGAIRALVRQPVFVLAPSVRIEGEARARPAIRYRADAGYVVAISGRAVVEDVKSTPTAKSKEFRRIQHLMKSVHGIDVRIVR